jgi:hypothetical protein
MFGYRRFTVDVPTSVFSRLAELALLERRAVRDQAAVLLSDALRSPGLPRQGVQDLVDPSQPLSA